MLKSKEIKRYRQEGWTQAVKEEIGTIFTILLIRLRIFVFKQSMSSLRATAKAEQFLFFRLSTMGGGGGGDDGKEKQHIIEGEFFG